MAVTGIVLAAGAGRRFGRPKATVELDGERLVDRAVRTALAGGCAPVLAVLGAVVVDVPGAVVVVNDAWPEGMGSSLRAGLAAAGGADAALVLLADQPGITPAAVARLVAAAGPGALAQASYGGVRAHPVLLGRDHWAGVTAAASGDTGARPYLVAHHVEEIPCDGLGDPADVDRPGDLPST